MLEPKVKTLEEQFKLILESERDSRFFHRLVEYIPRVLNDPELYSVLRRAYSKREDVKKQVENIEELARLYLYSLEMADGLKLLGVNLEENPVGYVQISFFSKELKKVLNEKLPPNEPTVFVRKKYQDILEALHFDLVTEARIQIALGPDEEVSGVGDIALFHSVNQIRMEIGGVPVRPKPYRDNDLWLLLHLIKHPGTTADYRTLSFILKGPTGFEMVGRDELSRAVSRLKKVPELEKKIRTEHELGYSFLANLAG